MPVTRSSSQSRLHPFTASPPGSRSQSQNATTTQHRTDIVVTVTSPNAESTAPKKRTSKRKDENPRSRLLRPVVEVIEISSDDETPPPRPGQTRATMSSAAPPPEPAAIADFRRQISVYRGEAARSKKDLERVSKEAAKLREENKELQKLRNAGNGKITLDTGHLSDQLECEICTARMWTPYVLPDCGHTFCQSCLQDWFSTTQAQFMASNPGYNPNQLISNQNVVGLYNVAQALTHHPHTVNSPHTTALIAQFLPPQPQYSCPTCRETVTSRPIEVFALKAMFRTVTTAMGESSPKRTKQSEKAPAASPWDGFFVSKKA